MAGLIYGDKVTDVQNGIKRHLHHGTVHDQLPVWHTNDSAQAMRAYGRQFIHTALGGGDWWVFVQRDNAVRVALEVGHIPNHYGVHIAYVMLVVDAHIANWFRHL
jgi:hypothetical protein